MQIPTDRPVGLSTPLIHNYNANLGGGKASCGSSPPVELFTANHPAMLLPLFR